MLDKLENILKELQKVAICYSGGIDSSFLLFVANKVLPKENVLAIIVNGQMVSRDDYNNAMEFAKENDFNILETPYNAFEVKDFKENHKNRCYSCKKNLMKNIINAANDNGFKHVLDGKNIDDTKVYRPGNIATKELGIISPLEEVGFTKEDIRKYSKEFGIKFWNKPSNSCLATRFPYDTILEPDDLKKVELAEKEIKKLDIERVRVRVHGDIARIEVESKDFTKILEHNDTINEIKDLGFKFVTLDLFGIKSGAFD